MTGEGTGQQDGLGRDRQCCVLARARGGLSSQNYCCGPVEVGGWAEEGLYVVGWAEEGLCVGSNGCGVGGVAEVCDRLVRTMTEGLSDSRLFSVCPRKIEA